MNQIIVHCPRERTQYVRLTPGVRRVKIEYFTVVGMRFVVKEQEVLTFTEHPELSDLFAGPGWNMAEVHALLYCRGVADLEAEEITPTIPSGFNPLLLSADEYQHLAGGQS